MLQVLLAATDFTTESTDAATNAAAGGIVAGLGVFFFVFVLIAIVLGVFTIWMFIDSLMRSDADYEKIGSGSKIVWALLIFFLGFIPAVIYYFMIKKKAGAAPAQTPPAAPQS